jgi:uncharacterized protein (TIGR02118 family)
MVKVIILLKKKPGFTDEEFVEYWHKKHGPLAVKTLPGVVKYVQNHLIKLPGVNYEADGIAELWFDDMEAFQKFMKWRETDEAMELREDEARYLDRSKLVRFIVEEHEMKYR